uniref:Secreted protein n=1 Tax=Parascaris univalens TaxID=6257 RepID=A0A915C1C9_PARUN
MCHYLILDFIHLLLAVSFPKQCIGPTLILFRRGISIVLKGFFENRNKCLRSEESIAVSRFLFDLLTENISLRCSTSYPNEMKFNSLIALPLKFPNVVSLSTLCFHRIYHIAHRLYIITLSIAYMVHNKRFTFNSEVEGNEFFHLLREKCHTKFSTRKHIDKCE